jgi:hypothetical protein
MDTYSYTQVQVTRNRLTLRPKNLNGRPLREDGEACGPFTFNAR